MILPVFFTDMQKAWSSGKRYKIYRNNLKGYSFPALTVIKNVAKHDQLSQNPIYTEQMTALA